MIFTEQFLLSAQTLMPVEKGLWGRNTTPSPRVQERDFFIDNLMVRNYFFIVMISRTGLAPQKFGTSVPRRLTNIPSSLFSTKGPMWGYPRGRFWVLGTVLEPF